MNPDALTMFSKKEVTQKTKIKVGVGIFIIDDQGRILLERRKDCGMWGLPGGKIDIDFFDITQLPSDIVPPAISPIEDYCNGIQSVIR